MKTALMFLCLLAAGVPVTGQTANTTKVSATTTLHNDGTRTDAVKDLFKHELSETTFDARGVVIMKKKFLLGENGDPTQGAVYDGADNVIARAQFFFDDLGRVVEERLTNNQNEVFQRIFHEYDISGKPLPPKVVNLAVKSPGMRPSKVDFTQSPGGRTNGKNPAQPGGQVPQIETASPGSRAVVVLPNDPAQQPPNLQVPLADPPKTEPKKKSKLNPLNWFRKD